jgi:hypothetical protein
MNPNRALQSHHVTSIEKSPHNAIKTVHGSHFAPLPWADSRQKDDLVVFRNPI